VPATKPATGGVSVLPDAAACAPAAPAASAAAKAAPAAPAASAAAKAAPPARAAAAAPAATDSKADTKGAPAAKTAVERAKEQKVRVAAAVSEGDLELFLKFKSDIEAWGKCSVVELLRVSKMPVAGINTMFALSVVDSSGNVKKLAATVYTDTIRNKPAVLSSVEFVETASRNGPQPFSLDITGG
jgi:hypothetical protein